jgi:small subunit ribosomal protein S2
MEVKEDLVKELFKNMVHIGHSTQKWNPKMKKYLYCEDKGYHVINLEKTIEKLDEAIEFLRKNLSEGKTILFVSTKPQSINLVSEFSESLNMPFVVSKWIPGLLTNFSTLKNRIKYLIDLKEKEVSGELSKYTKKELSKIKKVIGKLQISLGGVEKLKSKPDVVFIVDVVRDAIVVEEANKLGIPIVAFVDSNADPKKIDYPVPANDDAIKSLKFLFSYIKEGLGIAKKSK